MIATQSCQLAEATISARGAKTCQLTGAQGPVIFQLGSKASPTSTPFGASAFNDEAATRKTLDFRLTEQQDESFKQFDKWAVSYLAEHSERLFKKKQTEAQIQEHYRSPLTRKEGFAPLLRCKINTVGKSAARCWDEEANKVKLPEDLRQFELVPQLHLSHLWIMGRDFGWVLNVTDLMVLNGAAEAACPFA